MFDVFDLVPAGQLAIGLRVLAVDPSSGIRFFPLRGASKVAAIGIYGLTGLRRGQKIDNLMMVGDVIQRLVSEKRVRFKKFKEPASLDLYRSFENGETITFGFAFSVGEGDYNVKALFTVTAQKLIEYGTNAKPVTGVIAPNGLEVIEFEFNPTTAHVDYVKELDAAFHYRVKEQQRKILDLVGAGK